MAVKAPAAAPVFFATAADFRRWLARNAHRAGDLVVGIRKVGTGLPSMTWPESVDEALCFGWIDGVRKRVDDATYQIRFTPRPPATARRSFTGSARPDSRPRGRAASKSSSPRVPPVSGCDASPRRLPIAAR